jgi:heat shock protein HtpX
VVAVTEGILRALSRDELRGVLAHEIAHIRNRDVLIATVAAILASAISAIANVFQWVFLFGGAGGDEDGPHPLAALAMLLIAPIAATLIQLGISRSREFVADETAAQLTGDPDALARALESLERAAQVVPSAASPATASLYIVHPLRGGGGFARWFSTHPPTAERVRRLRALLGTIRTVA